MGLQDAVPLQISRKGPNTLVTSSPKRQRPHSGLARSFRAWISDNQATASPEPEPYLLRSVKRGVPSSSQSRRGSNASERKESDDSTWDIVEDLPLRWATDFIPLAGAKSRLSNVSVLFFELWKNDGDSSKGNAMLAVATKQNILLYETPIGERAFRYVKVRHLCTLVLKLRVTILCLGILHPHTRKKHVVHASAA